MSCITNENYIRLVEFYVKNYKKDPSKKEETNVNKLIETLYGNIVGTLYEIPGETSKSAISSALSLTQLALRMYKDIHPDELLEENLTIPYIKSVVGIREIDLYERKVAEITPEMSRVQDKIRDTLFSPADFKSSAFKLEFMSGDVPLSLVVNKNHIDRRIIMSVTEIVNMKPPVEKVTNEVKFNEAIEYGNVADRFFKSAISSANRNLTYSELAKFFENNPILKDYYAQYFYGDKNKKFKNSDPVILKAYEGFIEDVIHMLKALEEKYPTSFITTFNELRLFDKDNYISGEPDIIIIHPNMTFSVGDLKTSGDGRTLIEKRNNHVLQTAAYDAMIQKNLETNLGIKSSGKSVIVEVLKSEQKYRLVPSLTTARNISRVRNVNVHTQDNPKYEVFLEHKKKIDPYYQKYEITDRLPKSEKDKDKDKNLEPKTKGAARNFTSSTPGSKFKGLPSTIDNSLPISTKETLNKEIKWLLKTFPELKLDENLRIVKTLLSDKGGLFIRDIIILAQRSNIGVGYHEGWHRFSQLYLTKEEKIKMYESLQNMNLNFRIRGEDTLINSKNATFEELEEMLAEEFAKYALNPDGYKGFKKNEVVKNIFQRIWDIIKTFAKRFLNIDNSIDEKAIIEMFSNLRSGSFYRSNYNVNNSMFNKLNAKFKNRKGEELIVKEDLKRFISLADNIIGQHLEKTSSIISEYASAEGMLFIKNNVLKNALREEKENIEESGFYNEEDDWEQIQVKQLEIILDPENYNNFFKTYLQESAYEVFRKTKGSLSENNLNTLYESTEQIEFDIDQQLDDEGRPSDSGMTSTKFSDEGNRNPMDISPDIRDFFVGIKELNIDRRVAEGIDLDQFVKNDDFFQVKYIDPEKAFAKLKQLASGIPTFDEFIKIFDNDDNYVVFPELIYIKHRIFGNPKEGTKGLYNRFLEINSTPNISQELYYKSERIGHFLHALFRIMSMSRHEEIQFSLNTNINEASKTTKSLINVFKSPDKVEYNILNDFKNGLYNKSKTEDLDYYASYWSTLDDIFEIFNEGNFLERDFTTIEPQQGFLKKVQLKHYLRDDQKYFVNTRTGQLVLNPYYLLQLLNNTSKENPSAKEVKEIYDLVGLQLDENAYIYDWQKIKKGFSVMHSNLKGLVNQHFNALKYIHSNKFKRDKIYGIFEDVTKSAALVKQAKEQLKESKDIKTRERIVEDIKTLELIYKTYEAELERNLPKNLFISDPIKRLVNDYENSRNLEHELSDFAWSRTIPILMELTAIEKNYRNKFTSGSVVISGNESQYVYYLPSMMTLGVNNINYAKNIEDLGNISDVTKLNPATEPRLKYSSVFSILFDEKGNKVPGYKLELNRLSTAIINDEQTKISDLESSTKIMYDFLMGHNYGIREIRRAEASNSNWALYLSKDGNPIKLTGGPIAPIKAFINQMFNYVSAAMLEFNQDLNGQYSHRVKENKTRLIDSKKGVTKSNLRLGVFDDMFDKTTINKLKDLAVQGKDMNDADRDLQLAVELQIDNYIDKIAITNEDSYLNELKNNLSQNDLKKLEDLAFIAANYKLTHGAPVDLLVKENYNIDKIFKDDGFIKQVKSFIRNDMLWVFEEQLLFFSDYSNYKDPIKRRKILVNSGTTISTDSLSLQLMNNAYKHNSISSVYFTSKGLDLPERDFRYVRRLTIKDIKKDSEPFKKLVNSNYIKNYINTYPTKTEGLNDDQVKDLILNELKVSLKAMTDIEVADAAAYISLDAYRLMRIADQTWNHDLDEKEFIRQKLIFAKYLGETLTDEEIDFINAGPISSFNVAKMAATSPIANSDSFKNIFDKMGLKPLLPDTDWIFGKTADGKDEISPKKVLFEFMLMNNIDYAVFDSGTKAWKTTPTDVVDPFDKITPIKKISDDQDVLEIPRGYFKLQLNTSSIKEKSVFATQLRGLFHEIALLVDQGNSVPESLKQEYNKYLNSMRRMINYSSKLELQNLGIDQNGNFEDKERFVSFIKDKLSEFNEIDTDLLDNLEIDLNKDFVKAIESLGLNSAIKDVLSGLLDSIFRRIELPGSKLYMSPEILSTNYKSTGTSTIGLKWAGLIIDKKGNITGVSPVEVKLSLGKHHLPLLKLMHKDGKPIEVKGDYYKSLERLNEMLRDDNFKKEYKNELTFIGLRIPLQDLNFVAEMQVVEFLPASNGDIIIAPPEFYKQIGGDNDIDTITASYKTLDKKTGRVIEPLKNPNRTYDDIISDIENAEKEKREEKDKLPVDYQELRSDLSEEKKEKLKEIISNTHRKLNDYITDNYDLIEREYQSKNISEDNMWEDLKKVFPWTDNVPNSIFSFDFEIMPEKSKIKKVYRNSKVLQEILKNIGEIISENQELYNEQIEESDKKIDEFRKEIKEIRDTIVKIEARLKDLYKEKSNYGPSILNEVINSISAHLSHPSNIINMAETDAMDEIEDEVINIMKLRGEPEKELNQSLLPLDSMSIKNENVSSANNSKRKMLGVFVKFRKVFSILIGSNAELNEEYVTESVTGLKNLNPEKARKAKIFTPLSSSNKMQDGKLKLGLFDKTGKRTTKRISLIVSTLLDLFKNLDTFPGLYLTWNNYKQLLFLVSTGVPIKDALIFINNPFTQYFDKKMTEQGRTSNSNMLKNYMLKHAIVDSFAEIDYEGGSVYFQNTGRQNFSSFVKDENGKNVLNSQLPRPFSQLSNMYENEFKDSQITMEKLYSFTNEFYKSKLSLPEFIRKNPQHHDFAKQLHIYSAMLVDYGDILYTHVKGFSRDSIKVNDEASVSEIQDSERAMENSRLFSDETYKQIKNNSTLSFLNNDDVVNNVSKKSYPLLHEAVEKNSARKEEFDLLKKFIFTAYTKDTGRKDRLLRIFYSDFEENIVKNYYYIVDKKRKVFSTLDRYFLRDSNISFVPYDKETNSISDATYGIRVVDGKVVRDNRFLTNYTSKDNEIIINDNDSFANFHKTLLTYLPELKNIDFFNKLVDDTVSFIRDKEEPVNNEVEEESVSSKVEVDDFGTEVVQEEEFDEEEFYSAKSVKAKGPQEVTNWSNKNIQKFLYFNLNPDPSLRVSEKETLRTQWRKLINFDVNNFLQLRQKALENDNLGIYETQFVKELISNYAYNLVLFAIRQSMPSAEDGFSDLAPVEIVDSIIKKAFDNFKAASHRKSDITKFVNAFRLNNYDIEEIKNLSSSKEEEMEEFALAKKKKKGGKLYEISANKDEALKSSDDFIIQLSAEGFKFGENELRPSNYELIRKLQELQDEFKQCKTN